MYKTYLIEHILLNEKDSNDTERFELNPTIPSVSKQSKQVNYDEVESDLLSEIIPNDEDNKIFESLKDFWYNRISYYNQPEDKNKTQKILLALKSDNVFVNKIFNRFDYTGFYNNVLSVKASQKQFTGNINQIFKQFTDNYETNVIKNNTRIGLDIVQKNMITLSNILSIATYDLMLEVYDTLKNENINSSKITLTKQSIKRLLVPIFERGFDLKDIGILSDIFLNTFGTDFTKAKIAAKQEKDENVTEKYYPSQLSQKYNIPDKTFEIYRNIGNQKVKTLFTECKRTLLMFHNLDLTGKRIPKEQTDIVRVKVNSIDNLDINLIPTDNNKLFNAEQFNKQFYIKVENENYLIKTIKYNDNNIIGKIELMPKQQNIIKKNITGIATPEFQEQFAISGAAAKDKPEKSDEEGKLKKTLRVIGLYGADSIWATAAGKNITGIVTDIKDIKDIWYKAKSTDKPSSKTADEYVRYQILNNFMYYLVCVENKSDIKISKIDILQIKNLSQHIQLFDDYIKYIFEITNMILYKYESDNTEYISSSLILNYIKQKKIFNTSNGDNMIQSIMRLKNNNYNPIEFVNYLISLKILK